MSIERDQDFEQLDDIAAMIAENPGIEFENGKYVYYGLDPRTAFAAVYISGAWAGWQAKAKAVPENKIEFDGEYIKYPNSYAIHCQFDEDFDCHIFDVYQNEDCVKDGMTQLKQAHLFVFSMIEAQEPK